MGSRRIEESRRSGKRAGREAVHHIRDARRPPAHSTGSPTCGPRASGPPCAQRLERPEAGETPAVHHTRDAREPTSTRPTARGPVDRGSLARCASNDSSDPRRARRPRSTTRETTASQRARVQRLADQWTAGLWPPLRPSATRSGRCRATRGGGARAESARRLRFTCKAGETPAVHRTRDDRRPPAHSTGSPTCGPRASGPPCAQRLERPEAGETPAVHHTRDAREPTSTRPTARGPVDRGSLARCASNDSSDPRRARRPRSTTRETPAVHHTRDDRGPPHASRPRPT